MTERCSVCGQDAVERCIRCGQPVCIVHSAIDRHHRCMQCEHGHAPSRLYRIVEASLLIPGMLVGVWLFGGYAHERGYMLGGNMPWAKFSVYCALSIAAVTMGVFLQALLHKIRRARFLAQRS